MSNNIILKKSSVGDKVPLAGDLQHGELALNFTDGKLYFKNTANAIKSFTNDEAVVTLAGTQTITGTKTIRSSLLYQSPDQANTISSNMLDGGTLAYEGTAGQLFSITDSMTGTIFSVNDVSGIPSIEVLDSGLVKLAEFNGNVGVGTPTASFKLEVNGSFAATTKSFVIPHPTKEGKKLRYGSLEGPENGIYIRGKLTGTDTIELPDYWTKLVDPDSITVTLTPIGTHQKLYVKDVCNNTVTVGNENLLDKTINCYYVVYAERCDVEKLEVEIDVSQL